MAVLIQHITVVVPLKTLENKFPGGREAFQGLLRRRRFCFDQDLIAVHYWELWEVKIAFQELFDAGFKHSIHMVVVDRSTARPRDPCSWLFVQQNPDGVVFATQDGDDLEPLEISVPEGWELQHYLGGGVNEDRLYERDANLKFVGSDDKFDFYLDFETGQEIRAPVAKPTSSFPAASSYSHGKPSRVAYRQMFERPCAPSKAEKDA